MTVRDLLVRLLDFPLKAPVEVQGQPPVVSERDGTVRIDVDVYEPPKGEL